MSRFFNRLVVRVAMCLAAALDYQPKPLRLPEQTCPRPLARRCSIDPECLLPDGHRGDCDPEEYT
jgi:hypothetical protein